METVEGTLQDHNSSHLRQCFYGIVPYGTVPKWVRLGLALTGLAGTDPNGAASRTQMDPLTQGRREPARALEWSIATGPRGFGGAAPRKFFTTTPFSLPENEGNAPFCD